MALFVRLKSECKMFVKYIEIPQKKILNIIIKYIILREDNIWMMMKLDKCFQKLKGLY